MKKRNVSLLILLVILVLSFTYQISNAEKETKIFLEGKTLKEPALIENGRTYLPLRDFFEAQGWRVSWEEKNQWVVAKKGSDTIRLSTKPYNGYDFEQGKAYKDRSFFNNIIIILQDYDRNKEGVLLKNGKSYLPARGLGHMLGLKTEWQPKLNRVSIYRDPNVKITLKNIDNFTSDMQDESDVFYYAHPLRFSQDLDLMDSFYFIAFQGKAGGSVGDVGTYISRKTSNIYDAYPIDGKLINLRRDNKPSGYIHGNFKDLEESPGVKKFLEESRLYYKNN